MMAAGFSVLRAAWRRQLLVQPCAVHDCLPAMLCVAMPTRLASPAALRPCHLPPAGDEFEAVSVAQYDAAAPADEAA